MFKVDGVTRDAQSEDLPGPVAGHLLPEGIAGDQHAAMRRNVAFAHEIAARVETAQPIRQAQHIFAIFCGQLRMRFELPKQILQRMIQGGHYAPASRSGGSSDSLSVATARGLAVRR
jgi:hypothetical protein